MKRDKSPAFLVDDKQIITFSAPAILINRKILFGINLSAFGTKNKIQTVS